MNEYIEKPDMQYILHIKSDKKVEKRLIDYCLESVVDIFEDTGLTADVQRVTYAEWICHEPEIGLYYSCSRCGHNALQGMYRFCPNCGAQMNESEDDKHE